MKKIWLVVLAAVCAIVWSGVLYGIHSSAPDLMDTIFGGDFEGSAKDITDGKTIVVSIFTDDPNYSWDFSKAEDRERRENIKKYLKIAGDFLESEAKRYGKSAEFITDFDLNPHLEYHVKTDVDMERANDDDMWATTEYEAWDIIDNNIDVEALKKEFDAKNVVFMNLFNTDENCTTRACTRSWYAGMESDNEVVFMYYEDEKSVNSPAVYAHEILHTFAAPDLYEESIEDDLTGYKLKAIQDRYPNDIMLTCSDIKYGGYDFNEVTNEISEVTARFINLI